MPYTRIKTVMYIFASVDLHIYAVSQGVSFSCLSRLPSNVWVQITSAMLMLSNHTRGDGREALDETVLCADIVEGIQKHYCVTLFLVLRVSTSRVQFRAGSSIRGQGGSLHPAAQLIAHPRYDYYTIDFDVAVARVSCCFSFVCLSS
jgi:hypothetical protein